MKKLSDILNQRQKTYSFEFFPPKTEAGYQNLLATIEKLATLKPDFMSVTCGAFGGNRERTAEIVEHIQNKHRILGVQHVTCIGNTREEIKEILDKTKSRGILNVLALRGDPPQDNPNWQPGKNNFRYSYELCEFIRSAYGDYFSIGVAGFPEGHVLCPDKEQDARYLKMKIDAGADYVISQLFFENKDYFKYVERLRKLGVRNPIIPGIIPITDYQNIVNFCKKCGASIPKKVHDIFAPIAGDPQKTISEGIKFAVNQCRELLKNGAPGLHFYTLNKVQPVDTIFREVRG
ncbi:MAG TPA: methylenetetrahydrofolate reductase [NAD(P)H] [Candidatus Omnitrophota bacterium]|nr:methylenetetrahydrofolate reductase [NAD(P)H] [Candidatus Omnitrophota bacterium]HPD84119.1 methylenetetrahydrofolate reductase [NAD(P)H] [Candidatus Omnitrophota bacterium]HRZ02976.1 methylenetetrahydrofolate reductase [NAD(P)H] [Candidatus Omnitrophota bacterium]